MAFSKCGKTFDYWDAAVAGDLEKVKFNAIDYYRYRDTRPYGHGHTALILAVLHDHPEVFHLLYQVEYDLLTDEDVEFESRTFATGTPAFAFAICAKNKRFQQELERFFTMPTLATYIVNFESSGGETALHFVASTGNCLFLAESAPDRLIAGATPAIIRAADNGLTPLFEQLLAFVRRGYRSLTEKRNLQKIKDYIVYSESDLRGRLKSYKACREVFEDLVKQCKLKDEF